MGSDFPQSRDQKSPACCPTTIHIKREQSDLKTTMSSAVVGRRNASKRGLSARLIIYSSRRNFLNEHYN
ncbi:MAG: hypothetical protein ACFFDI_21115 [Promethearchaeota archaeon]